MESPVLIHRTKREYDDDFLALKIALMVCAFLGLCVFNAWALVDSSATAETVALYGRLQQQMGNGTMLGIADYYTSGSDDIGLDAYRISGKFPQYVDFWLPTTADAGDFSEVLEPIRRAWLNNVTVAANDHFRNYMSDHSGDGTAWDNTGTITRILPGGADRAAYLAALNVTADFFNNLTDFNGNKIPVLFAPFHENDGAWFWWGITSCSDANYVSLWQDLVTHFRDTKGVHNVLYVYSPQIINGYTTYNGTRYPGNEYVDVVSCSIYSDLDDLSGPMSRYNITYNYANASGKPFGIREGFRLQSEGAYRSDYWTWYFGAINNTTTVKKAAFIGVWTSGDYGPAVGRGDAWDFSNLTNQTWIKTVVPANSTYVNGVRLR